MGKNESLNHEKFKSWLNNKKITQDAYSVLMNREFLFENKTVFHDTKQLKISVAISTYRRPSFLIRLLDSIKSQIYDNIEIVIVDDCSNDDTESTVEQYKTANTDLKIKFLVNGKNKGAGETKKRAFLACSGDIIIFSDDDDYYIDNAYFSTLNHVYSSNPNCAMTVAGSITHYDIEDTYCLQELSFNQPITTKEYLNGFVHKYTKPGVNSMSMCSKNAKAVELENVSIYNMHGKNLTGHCRADFILANLDAKEDIYSRAISRKLLASPQKWYFRNITMTSSYYLIGNRNVESEDLEIWKWMKNHFPLPVYYCYILRVLIARIKRGKPVNLRYIEF